MLGLIFNCFKQWVVLNYGETTWSKILAEAGHANLEFETAVAYSDPIIFDIATASSKLLQIPVAECVEKVGYHFLAFIKGTPYAKMLSIAGSNYVDLLRNLNALHGHMVASHFREMRSPQFKVSQEGDSRVVFTYTPGTKERLGLGPLLVGLLRAVAEVQFNISLLTVTLLKQHEDGASEYLLAWEDESESNSDDASDMEKEKYDYGLAPHLFAKAFPWHVIVDIAGRILQVGPSMSKIVGICAGMKFNDLFTIIQPANVDTKSVRRIKDATEGQQVVFAHVPPHEPGQAPKDPITFKGEFLYNRVKKLLQFIGSASVPSFEAAGRMGIQLNDFAIHDPAKDILFLSDAKDMGHTGTSNAPTDLADLAPNKAGSKMKITASKTSLPRKKTPTSSSSNSSPSTPATTPRSSASDSPNIYSRATLAGSGSLSSSPSLAEIPRTGYLGNMNPVTPQVTYNESIPIEEVLEFICKENLGLVMDEEPIAEWTYTLRSNLVRSLSLLQRLPSPKIFERLNLPLVLEVELVKIFQDPSELFARRGYGYASAQAMAPRRWTLPPLNAQQAVDDSPPSPKSEKGSARSALLGITDEMRQSLSSAWADISSKGNLAQFFDEFFKALSKDRVASKVFDGPSLREQSDAVMGFVGIIMRALEDPMRSVSSIRSIAVRFMIFGTARSQFQSIAAALATGVEKTLGSDRVTPMIRESWFSLTMSIAEMLLAEYDGIGRGIAGRVYKQSGQKWKAYYTLLTHEKLLLFRDQSLTDRKEDINITIYDTVEQYTGASSNQPSNYSFVLEPVSGSGRLVLCADTQDSMSHWITELGRRVKYWRLHTLANKKSK